MSAQHPNVKKLREYNRWRRGTDSVMRPDPKAIGELLDWAIRVCEAADRLVNGKGRRPENNYAILDRAVKDQS